VGTKWGTAELKSTRLPRAKCAPNGLSDKSAGHAVNKARDRFSENFQARCTFSGPHGREVKCDFAIPSKAAARILIESKGYGATSSKMTDILGDIRTIIAAKRPDTSFLFFTDGLTLKQRKNDLRKIVEFQNNGDITRIYAYAMADQFEKDLTQLRPSTSFSET